MQLDELLKTVEASTPDDWYKSQYPTFPKKHGHSYLAVFKPNVDISLVYGAIVNEHYQEKWLKKFSDKSPGKSVTVELRYCGSPVHLWTFVYVDGGRLASSSRTRFNGR